ncbi:VrrA/YqfQ family protein [Lentibacillus sp. CBA3610]|uniref:VrrA/YqfQ family protein n=1 Tax=Lentibacillus sp. CBA3610 TaxID=2518176 RepID=UPI00159520C7|nr:VrrA/YqfQ family protein [Lentibacillus sp. CBA3610]QKY69159.1 hypothetical protein Len3610_05640 [Lentibacillus sp. CBA3610]
MVWPIQQQQPNSGMMTRDGFFPGGPPPQQAPGGLQKLLSSQAPQSLLTPERISGLSQKLGNAQQVLNVVQQTAPLVQQYGPMVKNLPMLFKLVKALNEDDSEETAESAVSEDQPESEEGIDITDADPEEDNLDEMEFETVKSGESTPKLFI